MESLTHGYDVRTLPFENPTTRRNPSQKPGDNPLSVPTISILNNDKNTQRFLEDGLSEMPRMSFQSDPRSLESSYTGGDKLKPIQEPPIPPKRAKFTNTPLSPPVCRVLDCHKDLSSSKDYHKKHKVCEVHSKTGMVIVNGKEQRFCQQCSRFHELPEFDEGKRSCRKRLAGHNERRRKPQLDSYFGSSYSTNASKTSSIFPRAQCNNNKPKCNNNNNNNNKLIHGPFSSEFQQSPRNPIPMISNLPRKESPTKRGLNNTPWPVQEASVGLTNSGCALSLLSSRSNDLPNDSLSENVTPVGFRPEGSRQTVSLVELSIYLQRVEQQKYYEKFCL